MHRLTISLPDDVGAALIRAAHRRSLPVSAVARQAIAEHLDLDDSGQPRRLPFVGLADSGSSTLGRDAEEILAEDWGTRGA